MPRAEVGLVPTVYVAVIFEKKYYCTHVQSVFDSDKQGDHENLPPAIPPISMDYEVIKKRMNRTSAILFASLCVFFNLYDCLVNHRINGNCLYSRHGRIALLIFCKGAYF